MKKYLLLLCTAVSSFALNAQTSYTNVDMEQVINILENVQGHVFLSVNETRSLESIVGGTEAIQNTARPEHLTWEIANDGIATIDPNGGTIKANRPGQTIVTVHEPNDVEDFYIAVFVCPTITVKSPEGAIYTYQKMYGSPAKILLTQSNDYLVNCVMMEGGDSNDVIDVTDMVNEAGYFETGAVTRDMVLTVSMEERIDKNDGDKVVGRSGIDLQVNSRERTLTFVDNVDEENTIIKNGAKVLITDINGKTAYNGAMPSNKTISFLPQNSGVFNVTIDGIDGNFKIIMQ